MSKSLATSAVTAAASCWAALWAVQLARRLWALTLPCPARPFAAADLAITATRSAAARPLLTTDLAINRAGEPGGAK